MVKDLLVQFNVRFATVKHEDERKDYFLVKRDLPEGLLAALINGGHTLFEVDVRSKGSSGYDLYWGICPGYGGC